MEKSHPPEGAASVLGLGAVGDSEQQVGRRSEFDPASATETVSTLNGKKKVKTKTTVQATIHLTINLQHFGWRWPVPAPVSFPRVKGCPTRA